jgi:hypothetical protein
MLKLRIQNEGDTEVLLEFDLKNPYDFADLERKLKRVKGITSIATTRRKHIGIPDAVGYAKWNKSEIDSRVNQLRNMSGISAVKYRLVL